MIKITTSNGNLNYSLLHSLPLNANNANDTTCWIQKSLALNFILIYFDNYNYVFIFVGKKLYFALFVNINCV